MCSTCEAGFYCADDATSRAVMLATMICPAGMHCPAGSDSAPDLVANACKKGHYCLRGDEVWFNPQQSVKCPKINYSHATAQSLRHKYRQESKA